MDGAQVAPSFCEVTMNVRTLHNITPAPGKTIPPGSEIEIPDDIAERLLASGAVVRIKDSAAPPEDARVEVREPKPKGAKGASKSPAVSAVTEGADNA